MIYFHLFHHSLCLNTLACATLFLVYGSLMANFSWWISRSCMYPFTGAVLGPIITFSCKKLSVYTYIHCRIIVDTIAVDRHLSIRLIIFSIPIWLHPRIIEIEDEDILRADAHELVHRVCHLGPLDHCADRDPLGIFERHDRRRASARCDSRRVGEYRATHVILAHDILARSDDTRNARGDLIDEVRVLRRRGADQHRL